MKNYVFCLKWGTKYSPEYVNNLYAMVKRNLSLPFEFVCFTDDNKNLNTEITTKPLIDPTLKGWWGKVSYFKKPLFDFKGVALCLDLDIVIVDNIDQLFTYHPERKFCIMKDRDSRNGNNTTVMRFWINHHPDIYNDLNLQHYEHCTGVVGEKLLRNRYWGDQVWITEKRPKALNYPPEWVKSYKWDCLDKQKNFFVPRNCKIISFHGKPNPHEVKSKIGQYWYS